MVWLRLYHPQSSRITFSSRKEDDQKESEVAILGDYMRG